MVAKVGVVLLESSDSIAKVSLLVMILKSLLSCTLSYMFRISSDLYKRPHRLLYSKSYNFFWYHNLEGINSCAVLGMFRSVLLHLRCFPDVKFKFLPFWWQSQNTISIPLNVIWITRPNYSMGVGLYNSLWWRWFGWCWLWFRVGWGWGLGCCVPCFVCCQRFGPSLSVWWFGGWWVNVFLLGWS